MGSLPLMGAGNAAGKITPYPGLNPSPYGFGPMLLYSQRRRLTNEIF